jgi:hypothetical protein
LQASEAGPSQRKIKKRLKFKKKKDERKIEKNSCLEIRVQRRKKKKETKAKSPKKKERIEGDL